MNKYFKHILVTGASLVMLASVGSGLSVHASRYPVNVAYGTGFGRYIPWHHLHYITTNHSNHGVGSAGSPERPSWFKKHGHIFHMDDQADITSMDGIHNPSKAQLRRALRGHHYHKHYRKNRRFHRTNRKHTKRNRRINKRRHHAHKYAHRRSKRSRIRRHNHRR